MKRPVDFIQLETVSSTNTWAKIHALALNPSHLTCITAAEQTGGRGRQDRKWVSPKGNLYVSFYLTVPKNVPYLPNLGQLMALACAELLLEMKVPVQLKWPNDLLVRGGNCKTTVLQKTDDFAGSLHCAHETMPDRAGEGAQCEEPAKGRFFGAHEFCNCLRGKKMGGVLSETIPFDQSIGVILGLGLNVNMPEEFLKNLDQPATSLHLLLQKNIEPLSLLGPLLNHFFPHLATLQSFGFARLQPRFQELLAYRGKTITVQLPLKKVQGICDSITTEGHLKLLMPSGDPLILSMGQILQ